MSSATGAASSLPSSSEKSLITHLLDLDKEGYISATQHPFLKKAGQGTLPKKHWEAWLRQDRYYASVGYVKLMGGMLARCPFVGPLSSDTSTAALQTRIRKLLSGALANVIREVDFFEETAATYGLDLADNQEDGVSGEGALNFITSGYIDWMTAVGATGSFEEQVILLWAMEKLYYEAWSYAKKEASASGQPKVSGSDSKDYQAAASLFITNWTCAEFKAFLDEIEEVLHLVVGNEWDTGASKVEAWEAVWRKTLWFEQRFWEAGGKVDD